MAGRRRSADRVLGPYFDGRSWQYEIVVGGVRTRKKCSAGCSEADARQAVEDARDELACPSTQTVKEAVEYYVGLVSDRSGSDRSAEFERGALAHLVGMDPDRLAGALTARDAAGFLAELDGKALATRRSYWKALGRFSRWLNRRNVCPRDFAADHVARLGRRDDVLPWTTRGGAKKVGRGKPQLRNMAEVRAYLARALADGDPQRRVAACLPLLTGARSGEVLNLRVGSVDFEARVPTDGPRDKPAGVLHVRDDDSGDGWDVKTAAGRRDLQIPRALRADLQKLVKGQSAGAYVFRQADGRPHERRWLYDLVHDVCEKARVELDDGVKAPIRDVGPHGLRGTWSSVKAQVEGQAVAAIGDGLGQADKGRTARQAYIGAPPTVRALEIVVRNGERISSPISSPNPKRRAVGGQE